VLQQNVAGGPPGAAAGVMLKPHQTMVGNTKNGFAVYSSPLYQQMTLPVNPPQCYPLTSQSVTVAFLAVNGRQNMLLLLASLFLFTRHLLDEHYKPGICAAISVLHEVIDFISCYKQ